MPDEMFRGYISQLRSEGGWVSATVGRSNDPKCGLTITLSHAEPPQRAVVELKSKGGAPRLSSWVPVPQADRERRRLAAPAWRYECRITTPEDTDQLYAIVIEAVVDTTGSRAVSFDYRSHDPEIGCIGVVTPMLAVPTALAGLIALLVLKTPVDRALVIAVLGAIVGVVASFVPYNVVPSLRQVWPRLREGTTADDIVAKSFLVLPVPMTVLAIAVMRALN